MALFLRRVSAVCRGLSVPTQIGSAGEGSCVFCGSVGFMMTSLNGNTFRVTGLLCGEFTGQWRGAFMFSLIGARINGWVNNREAGDLIRHHVHYDVTVILLEIFLLCISHLPLWKIDVLLISAQTPTDILTTYIYIHKKIYCIAPIA